MDFGALPTNKFKMFDKFNDKKLKVVMLSFPDIDDLYLRLTSPVNDEYSTS